MELLNPKKEAKGKRPPVLHRGTFNANALVSAAGVAALGALRDGKPQRHADAIAAKIREGMARVLKKHEISGIIYGDSSTFRVYFGPLNGSSDNVDGLTALQLKSIPPKVVSAYAHAMRARGVEIMSYTGGVTSLAHTEKDVEQTLAVFDGAIGELAENGIIEHL
jgi:glutamate-1-semialdehyde 2,1-aminomutase